MRNSSVIPIGIESRSKYGAKRPKPGQPWFEYQPTDNMQFVTSGERTCELVTRDNRTELERLGRIDLAERRRRLIDKVAKSWRTAPPTGFVCAAGVAAPAPVFARLLRSISGLPQGMVVLPGLATGISDAEWDALGPHKPDPVTGRRRRSLESHPQFHLKLLLDRMGVHRSEFDPWRVASDHDAPPARSKAIASAMAPPELTHGWTALPAAERRLDGVRVLEVATPAEEAAYRTRVVVRRPAVEDFSGTVVVEWFNVSAIEAAPGRPKRSAAQISPGKTR